MWEIWDKVSDINNVSAKEYLNQNNHLDIDDIIYIKVVDSRIVQVESKRILGSIHNIDVTLPDDDFISAYIEKISAPQIFNPKINFGVLND